MAIKRRAAFEVATLVEHLSAVILERDAIPLEPKTLFGSPAGVHKHRRNASQGLRTGGQVLLFLTSGYDMIPGLRPGQDRDLIINKRRAQSFESGAVEDHPQASQRTVDSVYASILALTPMP